MGEKSVLKTSSIHAAMWYLLVTLCLLFLMQGARDLISSTYYFSLVDLGVSPISLVVLVFLIPLLTGPVTKVLGWRNSFILTGAVMGLSRLPMGFGLEKPLHLVFSAMTFASSGMLMALILALHRRERKLDPDIFSSQGLAASFSMSLLVLVLLNSLGRGTDPSIVPKTVGFWLSPSLSSVLVALTCFLLFSLKECCILLPERDGSGGTKDRITGGAADSWAPAFGLGGFMIVGLMIIANPLTSSSWMGTSYTMAMSFTMASVSLFIFSLSSGQGWLMSLRRTFTTPQGSIIGNILLLAAGANMFFFKIALPVAPTALVWISLIDMWLVLDAATDSRPFAGEVLELAPKDGRRRIIGIRKKVRPKGAVTLFGHTVTIGLAVFMTMSVLIVLAVNWSFVPLGGFLKGAVPVLSFSGVVVLALAGFLCSKVNPEEPSINIAPAVKIDKGSPTIDAGKGTGHIRSRGSVSSGLRTQWLMVGSITIALIMATAGTTFILHSGEIERKEAVEGDVLTVVTYNIHHGFSNKGRTDPVPVYEVLENIGPDIVFLQESDSMHLAEGNFDPGFYLASRLDMYYLRGSDPGLGCPGVSILSRFPLKDIKAHDITTDEISRIAISCKADLGEKDISLVCVHFDLDLESRMGQMEDVYSIISDMEGPVILAGDLNTEPSEEMMELLNSDVFGDGRGNGSVNVTGLGLLSAWHTVDRSQRNGPIDLNTYPSEGIDDEKEHIDYILCSPDLTPLSATIGSGKGASDHKPVWAEVLI